MAGTQTLEQLVVLVSVSESLLLLSDLDRRTVRPSLFLVMDKETLMSVA